MFVKKVLKQNSLKSVVNHIIKELSTGKQLISNIHGFFFIAGNKLRKVDPFVVEALIEKKQLTKRSKIKGITYYNFSL